MKAKSSLPGGEDTIPRLHLRASRWYEQNGFGIDAFRHAAACGDMDLAERLSEGKRMPATSRDVSGAVLAWLESLPAAALDTRPSLWVKWATYSLAGGRTSGVEDKLRAAEKAAGSSDMHETRGKLAGRIAVARATLALTRYESESMIAQSLLALERLDADDLPFGGEISGRVEAIGAKVRAFKPGDEVYGDTCKCGYGALAEFVCADENALAPKPATLSFEEAASVPQSALVALQGLRAGGIHEGRKVLVHGASGGIGTFAVQIAKSFGAEVTGACGARNLDMVRALGADHVIDYAKEDVCEQAEAYDLILAIRGTRPVRDYYRALRPGGTYVMAGGSLFCFMLTAFQGPRLFRSGSKTMGRFTYSPDAEDLLLMKGLIEAGKVRPVVDRTYPLSEAAEAFRYLGKGHARGRVVVRVA